MTVVPGSGALFGDVAQNPSSGTVLGRCSDAVLGRCVQAAVNFSDPAVPDHGGAC